MSAGSLDHYAVLGIAETASSSEVRSAFLRLIRESHPDAARERHRGAGGENTAGESTAGDRVTRIIAAYRCLHDPSSRSLYDRERRAPRERLVLIAHQSPPRADRSRAAIAGRIAIGLLLVACASGAIYILARDPGMIDQVFAGERPPAVATDRVRDPLRAEAELDVEWVMTVYGANMLGPLSRQCFTADPEQRSRAQCAYCIAFDDAAAGSVPGDAYFGDRARAARRTACPA